MDNYIEELINVAKLPFNEIVNDSKLLLISNKAFYLSNYKKLLDYSTSKIAVKTKKSTITIIGENLEIQQINKGEIIIKGSVYSINFGDIINEGKK